MKYYCPKHRLQLSVAIENVQYGNYSINAIVGRCPKCTTLYTSFVKFATISSITINGTSYIYMPDLSTDLPKQPADASKNTEIRKTKNESVKRKQKEPHNSIKGNTRKVEKKVNNGNTKVKSTAVEEKKQECTKNHPPKIDTRGALKRRNTQPVKMENKPHDEEVFKEELLKKYPCNADNFKDNDDLIIIKITVLPNDVEGNNEASDSTNTRYIAITKDNKKVNDAKGIVGIDNHFASFVNSATESVEQARIVRYKAFTFKVERVFDPPKAKQFVQSRFRFDHPVDVYLYRLKRALDKYSIISVTVDVFFPEGKKYIPLDCYYDERKGLFFINEESFEIIVSNYGLPFMRPRRLNDDGSLSDFGIELSSKSQLMIFGYNVSAKSGFSSEYRQKLLASLICFGLMTKAEIKNHLEFLISYNQRNVKNREALKKWKEDLSFLQSFQEHRQMRFQGRIVDRRGH